MKCNVFDQLLLSMLKCLQFLCSNVIGVVNVEANIIDINLILRTAYRMTCETVSSDVDLIKF